MIEYRAGDVTAPDERPAILAHVSNDVGRFGGRASVATAIGRRWPHVREQFLLWSLDRPPRERLGQVVPVDAEPGLRVANMVAQRGLPSRVNPAPLDLAHLETCLRYVASVARGDTIGSVTVVMPRIGTGYGGTPWTAIEPVIARALDGVPTVVYDLPKETRAPRGDRRQ